MNKAVTKDTSAQTFFQWGQLPVLPDSIGFAGSFAGVSHGALLVAGGANFPDGGAPWTGSTKKWYDEIFVLANPEGSWKEAGKLPRPLGYGVSVAWRDGVVCLGGSNESGHYQDAFILRYKDGKVEIEKLPDLPATNANACGAISGDTVYLAGGTVAADAKSSGSFFWALDLSENVPDRQWKKLPSWPGASRILGVAAVSDGAFYLFSGAHLKDGKREYLKDGYKYHPSDGWSRIADLPVPVVAAPGPAYTNEEGDIFIFGGDDGKHAATATQLKENHPGFSTGILAYNNETDTWTNTGKILTEMKEDASIHPNNSIWAPVTAPLVVWNGNVVFPGGEVRPATRTPRVLITTFKTKR